MENKKKLENKKELEKKLDRIFEIKRQEYQIKAENYLKNLDFERLEKIKQMSISEISENDLIYLGLERISHKDYEILYNCRDFDNIKIYFNRLPDRFVMIEYKEKTDIFTVQELVENSLLKWKLKLN